MSDQAATDNAIALHVNDTHVAARDPGPECSLLQFLREDAGLVGTKEGCASGDCGACTVIVREPDTGRVGTVNSCITPLAHAIGRQVVTVEGVGQPGALHPVQAAMVSEHGSQCGFCTPGFVMSLVAAQLIAQNGKTLIAQDRSTLVRSISGNLCRCTGYRPILSAAAKAHRDTAEQWPEATADAVSALRARADAKQPDNNLPAGYYRPATIVQLQALLPLRLPLIAGCTDFWLEVTQRYRDFSGLIDISEVTELRQITLNQNRLSIGAAVTHSELEAYFAQGPCACEAIVGMLQRFGSPQIRNRGTIGGNIANASPIADWAPVLLALDATVVLQDAQGAERVLPIQEFYLGYKETQLQEAELLAGVECRCPDDWNQLHVYKLSKRHDDDISSTLGAFLLELRDGVVARCRVAFGGVAAIPVRFSAVEDLLLGQPLTETLTEQASELLRTLLEPISDVRASADYRREASVALLRKALSAQAGPQTLEAFLS